MNLTINGEARVLPPAETLVALVEQLGMKSDRVAIELNREIVPRDQWALTPLHDGDRLEIVQFVGGGSPPLSAFVIPSEGCGTGVPGGPDFGPRGWGSEATKPESKDLAFLPRKNSDSLASSEVPT